MRLRRSRGFVVLAGTAVAGLLLAGLGAGNAGASSSPCSEPPSVEVDQSDPDQTTITISLACEAEAEFHRIVTATLGGVEILRIDTRTEVTAAAEHTTTVTIAKAQVCITDPDADEEVCVPA